MINRVLVKTRMVSGPTRFRARSEGHLRANDIDYSIYNIYICSPVYLNGVRERGMR